MKANIKRTNFKLPTPIQHNNPARPDVRKRTTVDSYPDRRSKRYFTSRQEQEKQDNFSACPSIEKELPELSIHLVQNNQGQDSNRVIEELIKQNRLKEQALKKATDVIELLREENNDLNERIEELEGLLRDKERLIELLEEEKLNFSQEKIVTRDILSQRLREGDRDSKTQLYTPRELGVASKNDLFFQFAHNQRQPGTHRSQDKIINNDHPTFKDIHPQITISKKLTPYPSRHPLRPQPEPKAQTAAITKLAMLTIQQQLEKNQLMVEQLDQFTRLQQQQLQELLEEAKGREGEWLTEMAEEYQDGRCSTLGENISKNLFGNGSEQSNHQSLQSILTNYEVLIEKYRDYSAYLKSYLCQAINALNFIASKPSQTEINLLPLLKIASKQIALKYKHRLLTLQRQNQQLKCIIEGLIRNIQMTRKGEPSVRHWSQYPLQKSK